MNIFTIVTGFLVLIGSLGIFLYGMKLMSEGLQKIAGNKMRFILSKMTSKPANGVLTGALITTTIQSSSATTVMVVSFVNAGLLSLAGAISVIMGANIGTTVTAWIISLLGFKFSISAIAIPLFGLAMFLFFSKKSKYKSIGEFIIGFCFLFLGLEYLKNSVPDITQFPQILESIASLSSYGYLSIILFVIIGSILTVVVQSSSAMMAVTLVMCSQGWVSFEIAAAMVLGENIGTTVTANLAAIMANSTAKKAARAHFLFNVLGVIWMLIVFRFFLQGIDSVMIAIGNNSPFSNPEAIPVALSLFHSSFNILNTLLLVWFIPVFIKIVNKMVKTKEEEEEFRLQHIPTRFVSISELDLESAKKELETFANRLERMYGFLPDLVNPKTDEKHFAKVFERTAKYEEITDRMEIEIATFLTKISESELSNESSLKISYMLRVVDNLESIGDAIYQLAIFYKSKREQGIVYGTENDENLEKMYVLVGSALNAMCKNLSSDYEKINIVDATILEAEINLFRDKLREQHLEAIKQNKYSYATGISYSGVYALYEKLGDFIINVSEALEKTKENYISKHLN